MSKIEWNDDTSYGLTFYKLVTWPTGTWPLEKKGILTRIRSLIVVVCQVTELTVLFPELIANDTNPGIRMDICMLFGSCSLTVGKITLFNLYPDNLNRNFTSAVKDYAVVDSLEKRMIMRHHAYIGKLISRFMLWSAYLASLLFIVQPVILRTAPENINDTTVGSSRYYPVPCTYFISQRNITPTLYVLIYSIQSCFLFVTSTANLGSDALFLCMTMHVCGQVELLKMDLMNCIKERADKTLQSLTLRHQELLTLSKLLIETVSLMLIMQLFVSCVIICLIGFQMILFLNDKDFILLWKATTVLSALLLQLLSYCYVGDYLKCQMEEVQIAAYSSPWYNFPTSIVKNMNFITMRAQIPVQLAAGGIFALNMESYMGLLKTSLSYLSVLRVMLTP